MDKKRYLNPIFPGDHPDPTILKDGENYYVTFSSFLSYPGIIIWHSTDLINWNPITAALTKNIGSIFALDLIKHNNRYYIYIPALSESYSSIYVIYADNITGPWSDPIDLKVYQCIDPGHAVGEDGSRYLFFDGVRRIKLSDDGLSTIGNLEKVYEPWKYPDDWVVEMFAPEGPKIFKKGDYFYMVLAVGGTAGPPTSHMVIATRSKSINGPWEDAPHNPIIRTKTKHEKWWSKGHASLVQGQNDDWWMVYHAIENGLRTLGRQTLLEPIEWKDDGWFYPLLDSPDELIYRPKNCLETQSVYKLSDDFSKSKIGVQWSFYNSGKKDLNRLKYKDSSLLIKGSGVSLNNSAPLTSIAMDRSYDVEVTLEIIKQAQGGLTLYYDNRMFCGLGFDKSTLYTYNFGSEHNWMRKDIKFDSVKIRLENRDNVITYYYSLDNKQWIKHPWQMEVSGMHHNILGGFSSLKIGLFSFNDGSVIFKNFIYRSVHD